MLQKKNTHKRLKKRYNRLSKYVLFMCSVLGVMVVFVQFYTSGSVDLSNTIVGFKAMSTLAAERADNPVTHEVIVNSQDVQRSFSTFGSGIDPTTGTDSWKAKIDPNTGLVTLTPDQEWMVGNITLDTKINLTQNFSFKGEVNLGNKNKGEGGADGIGFVFQPGDTQTVGRPGQWLGMGGVPNAFGFKLDTYYNAGFDPDAVLDSTGNNVVVNQDTNEAFGGFMSTNANGDMTTIPIGNGTPAKVVPTPTNNQFAPFEINYTAATHTLSITYGGITWTEDITSAIPSSGKVSFAITASTGGSKNQQQVKINQFVYYEAFGTVYSKYVDLAGNPIADATSSTGEIETPYSTAPLGDVPGKYHLVRVEGNETGQYTANDQTVTYVYAIDYQVSDPKVVAETIQYVDKNGKKLASDSMKQLTQVTITNPVTNEKTVYYKEGKQERPTVDPVTGKPDSSWTAGNGTFSQVLNPVISDYHVVSTTDPENDLTQVTEQQVTEQPTDLMFTVTYERDTGKVTVHAVDEQNNELLSPSSKTGETGSAYSTEPPQVPGYKLIKTPENATGNYILGNQDVVYVYRIDYKITDRKVIKETINYVDEKGKEVSKKYENQVTLIVVTNPVTNSTTKYYHTGDVERPELDVHGVPTGSGWIQDNTIKFNAVANPTVADYHVVSTTDPAKDLTQITEKTLNEGTSDLTYTVTYAHDKGTVTVHAVDEKGKELITPIITQDNTGEAYATTPPNVAGYKLITTPDNVKGNYVLGNQDVVYVYAINYTIDKRKVIRETIEYVDTKGKQVHADYKEYVTIITVNNPVTNQKVNYTHIGNIENPELGTNGVPVGNGWTQGESISFKAVPNPVKSNYHVVSTTDPVNNLTQITEKVVDENSKDLMFKVVYMHDTGTVTIHTVDKNGKKIRDDITQKGDIGTKYQTEAPKIAGYKLIKKPNNENGIYTTDNQDVTYIYEIDYKVINVKVIKETIHYVDKLGKVVFPDYESFITFVVVENPVTGDRTSYYHSGKEAIPELNDGVPANWLTGSRTSFVSVKNPTISGLQVISTTEPTSTLDETNRLFVTAESTDIEVTVVYDTNNRTVPIKTNNKNSVTPNISQNKDSGIPKMKKNLSTTTIKQEKSIPPFGEHREFLSIIFGGIITLGSLFLFLRKKNS